LTAAVARPFENRAGLKEVPQQHARSKKVVGRTISPEQGKEVKRFRRPATVIGTKAAGKPLSARTGRRGK
jgi:hypothetical protein